MMRISFSLLGLLVLLSPTTWALAVSHNPQVQIDRPAIRLSDVFVGLPVTQDVDIAVAPNPGRSVTYDYTVLSRLAQRYGLGWEASSYSDQTVITRASSRINAAMVADAVVKQLRDAGVQGELEVLMDQRSLEINLPAALKPDFSVHDFGYDKNNQRFHGEILAAVDTPFFQQIAITGRVSNVVAVPVLNKPLSQGTVIGKADIDWVKLPADRATDYVRTEADLVGMEVRRQMPEQAALRPQDLLPRRIVLRGTLVTMQVVMPGMQLTAQGRALQDGALGEVIRVTNTTSNRVVEARIVSTGLVEVVMTKLASLP
jgi:flagella basal body P-ring formation protein FlgA